MLCLARASEETGKHCWFIMGLTRRAPSTLAHPFHVCGLRGAAPCKSRTRDPLYMLERDWWSTEVEKSSVSNELDGNFSCPPLATIMLPSASTSPREKRPHPWNTGVANNKVLIHRAQFLVLSQESLVKIAVNIKLLNPTDVMCRSWKNHPIPSAPFISHHVTYPNPPRSRGRSDDVQYVHPHQRRARIRVPICRRNCAPTSRSTSRTSLPRRSSRHLLDYYRPLTKGLIPRVGETLVWWKSFKRMDANLGGRER